MFVGKDVLSYVECLCCWFVFVVAFYMNPSVHVSTKACTVIREGVGYVIAGGKEAEGV